MKTQEALKHSNELELLSYRLHLLAIETNRAGYKDDAEAILDIADRIASEAAYIWDNRDPPSLITADNVVILKRQTSHREER